MFIAKSLITLGVVFLLVMIGERVLKKRFKIEKKPGLIYKTINRQHKIGEFTLLGLFFIAIILDGIYEWTGDQMSPLLIFIFFTILHTFRAFMEWKYDKASKEYIVSIYAAVLFVLLFVILLEGTLVNWLLG